MRLLVFLLLSGCVPFSKSVIVHIPPWPNPVPQIDHMVLSWVGPEREIHQQKISTIAPLILDLHPDIPLVCAQYFTSQGVSLFVAGSLLEKESRQLPLSFEYGGFASLALDWVGQGLDFEGFNWERLMQVGLDISEGNPYRLNWSGLKRDLFQGEFSVYSVDLVEMLAPDKPLPSGYFYTSDPMSGRIKSEYLRCPTGDSMVWNEAGQPTVVQVSN